MPNDFDSKQIEKRYNALETLTKHTVKAALKEFEANFAVWHQKFYYYTRYENVEIKIEAKKPTGLFAFFKKKPPFEIRSKEQQAPYTEAEKKELAESGTVCQKSLLLLGEQIGKFQGEIEAYTDFLVANDVDFEKNRDSVKTWIKELDGCYKRIVSYQNYSGNVADECSTLASLEAKITEFFVNQTLKLPQFILEPLNLAPAPPRARAM
jgi:hypothetical protein